MPKPRMPYLPVISAKGLKGAVAALIVLASLAPVVSAIQLSAGVYTAPWIHAFSDWFAAGPTSYSGNQNSTSEDIKLHLQHRPLDAGMIRLMADKRHSSQSDLIKLAHQVSRRDLETQLSMIEVAIPQKRYKDIVHYADQALMANASSENIILPWLAQNVQLFRSEGAISDYATRPWFASFIKTGLARSDLADEFEALIVSTREARRQSKLENLGDSLLHSLADTGRISLVKQYLISTSGPDQVAINPVGFADFTKHEIEGLGPYTWQYRNTADGYLDSDHAGTLQIYVSPGRRVKIAELTTLYPPGNYQLSQHLASDQKIGGASAQWQITCQGSNGDFSVWSGELSRENIRDQQIQFTLPLQNCEKQHWSLIAIGGDVQAQSTAQLSSVTLQRISRN